MLGPETGASENPTIQVLDMFTGLVENQVNTNSTTITLSWVCNMPRKQAG